VDVSTVSDIAGTSIQDLKRSNGFLDKAAAYRLLHKLGSA
jgi:hypothetical protein